MRILLCAFLLYLSALQGGLPPEVQEVIAGFMREKQIPGLAAALYFNGQSYLINFGYAHPKMEKPVSAETIFEIASLTKVFTSEALAMELLQGKMQLNEPVTDYLGLGRQIPLGQVSLQHLATHTASLPRVPPGGHYTQDKVLHYFGLHWRPEWPIGTRYLYSNVGFGLLGYALANVEGIGYYQVLEKLILQPLGMHSTWIVVPPAMQGSYAQGFTQQGGYAQEYPLNAWPAGGALRSTSRDMLKFLLANLNVEGPEPLRKAMQVAQQGVFRVNEHLTLGLGWQRFQGEKVLFVDKNGGVDGFSSYIGMVPEKKMGVVLLANRAGTEITEAGRHLLRVLAR